MVASLRRRVVVVTGGSAGVGRAAAEAFARLGADVAILARGAERLEAARRDLQRHGGSVLALVCDVADERAVSEAVTRIEEDLGPIDVWVNNAMVSVFSPADRMDPDEIRRVTDVTYLGAVWGTLAVLPRMKARRRGVIVQVGSALAYRSIPLQSAYCAAKHALQGFTESLRTELLHERSPVSVVSVELPAVNTPQFDWTRSRMPFRAQPVPPIFAPEVAADAIVLAALEPERRAIFVGFPTMKAIYANRIAPGLADRYLARVGVDAQQTDEPETPGRPDNLFAPVPGTQGAHGRFDAREKPRSLAFSLTKHARLALGIGAGALAVTVALRRLG